MWLWWGEGDFFGFHGEYGSVYTDGESGGGCFSAAEECEEFVGAAAAELFFCAELWCFDFENHSLVIFESAYDTDFELTLGNF